MVEGVYTLPVMYTMASGHKGDELRAMLGRPLKRRKQKVALDIVRQGDGVARAIEMAHEYVARAERACDALPQNAATEALRSAASSLLSSIAN
jgi:geranylgeranyl pyrophosphate synthase